MSEVPLCRRDIGWFLRIREGEGGPTKHPFVARCVVGVVRGFKNTYFTEMCSGSEAGS